jgi:hypothetical protein
MVKSMSSWSSGSSTCVSFGIPGFKPRTGQISSLINDFVETHTVLHSLHWCQNWERGDSYVHSQIRVWSSIRNEKPIVLFERNCHATEKSEAIVCVRICQSSRLTGWWTPKEYCEKIKALCFSFTLHSSLS